MTKSENKEISSTDEPVQSFDDEHKSIMTGEALRVFSSFSLRAILIGQIIGINTYLVYTYSILECSKELSHWGLWLTAFWLVVSLKCSLDTEIKKKQGWLTANHLLFEIVTPMNLLITLVYWSILRERALLTYANTASKAWHSTMVHSAPIICTLINFLVSNIVIKASHGLILLPIGVVYGYINYS